MDIFFFTYNFIKNENLNINLKIERFCKKWNVIIKFITYTISFKIVAKEKPIFKLNSKFYWLQLIDGQKKSDSIFGKKKINLIYNYLLLCCISKTNNYFTFLNWLVYIIIQIWDGYQLFDIISKFFFSV